MIESTDGERERLVDYLGSEAGERALQAHLAGGGTFASFAAGWRAERDAAARLLEISDEVADQILALPARDSPNTTVRRYLGHLLKEVWRGEGGSKYGWTGESDWRFDVYEPMRDAGLIPSWRDGYGPQGDDEKRADRLVYAAIARLCRQTDGGAVA